MDNRRTSLIRHWSRAYFINLCIGILIISSLSILWVRYTTKNDRLDTLMRIGQELADTIVDDQGRFVDDRVIQQSFASLQRVMQLGGPSEIIVVDAGRNQVFPPSDGAPANARPSEGRTAPPPKKESGIAAPGPDPKAMGPRLPAMLRTLPAMQQAELFARDMPEHGKVYLSVTPILSEGDRVGEVVLVMDHRSVTRVDLNYPTLLSLIAGMLLLGWGTIYILTRRLVRPLQEVAATANALKDGHYEVRFTGRIKEKEVHDMVTAIKTMAAKLQHLESLRTVLFAGVTHELKTPIASISGMVQAVRDNLVEDGEREEFLELSIQETDRLRRMVDDLLDFNGFASGELAAQTERIELPAFLNRVVDQWRMIDEQKKELAVRIDVRPGPRAAIGDPLRAQQILTNLLNNACHASPPRGELQVSLYDAGDGYSSIDVTDEGHGIPEEDLPYIFERFYRGSNKKYKTKGLGLGLPFSLMLARAQKGDLYVKSTSPAGTTFTLKLPLP